MSAGGAHHSVLQINGHKLNMGLELPQAGVSKIISVQREERTDTKPMEKRDFIVCLTSFFLISRLGAWHVHLFMHNLF